jgi:hypothetical protein
MGAMTINEQVALLMQGAEYGDEPLKQAMAKELEERLVEAVSAGQARPAPGPYHHHAQAAPIPGPGA